MPGENCHRPVDLLGGHDSHQLVRPRHRPKAERERSRGQKRGFQTVRAANDEGRVGGRRVPRPAKLGGQVPARHVLAGLVKGNPLGKAAAEAGRVWLSPRRACDRPAAPRDFPRSRAARPQKNQWRGQRRRPARYNAPPNPARVRLSTAQRKRAGDASRPQALGSSPSDVRRAGRRSTFFRDCRTASPRAGRCGR